MIYGFRLRIGWRNFLVIGQANMAFESTINGVSVSSGGMGTHMLLRLRIITREVRS